MSIASLIPKISPSGKLGARQPQIEISSLFAAAHGLRTPAMTSRAICLEKMRFASMRESGHRTASSPNILLTNDSTSDEDRTFISPASFRMDGESNPASRRSAAFPACLLRTDHELPIGQQEESGHGMVLELEHGDKGRPSTSEVYRTNLENLPSIPCHIALHAW